MERINKQSNLKDQILLAGASGIIGSSLFNYLAQDFNVVGLCFRKSLPVPNMYSLDLTNNLEVKKFVKKNSQIKVLLFLVGLAHKKGKNNDYKEFNLINKKTLVHLLRAFDEENTIPQKIIFASTISIYGERLNQKVYKEDLKKIPFSPYAITKLEAEKFLNRNFYNKSWILRFAPVYSSKFKLNIIRRTKILNMYFRVGKGKNKLSLCNVNNIKKVVSSILTDQVPPGTYNISDKTDYNYNDLLKFKRAGYTLSIPSFIVFVFYYIGILFRNNFLIENAIKLLSDNTFPSKKIQEYVSINFTLNNLED